MSRRESGVFEPKKMMIISHLATRKDLLRALTERTIRARYQQSVLGGLWIIVQPVATVAMFSIIFAWMGI